MERIVSKPLKIDFHIHSRASRHKDKDLVNDGTKENVGTLITSLKAYSVDAFAITDHDCFDKDLYEELKKHEGVDFKKVFPGVEFSVWMEKEKKQIHVIAVFDDSDPGNLEKIESVIGYKENEKPEWDNAEHLCFSEAKFRDLLYKISVNAILIVHQKGSALPSAKPSNLDLKSLGKEKMNELINVEYFDAMEYKNPKQHVFQTLFSKSINPKTYDLVKFITGSDCHQWEHYPMHDIDTGDSEMQFTYLKCLPSFRGLVMSVTDFSRISCNEEVFKDVNCFISSIKLLNNGVEETIPLSKGINVIIGDNSTGKSALLHRMTGYSKIDGTTGLNLDLKDKYEAFFRKNNIQIQTSIKNTECDFSVQGGIRHKFEEGNFFEEFSKDKYPQDTDSSQYKQYLSGVLEPFYETIKTKHDFDNKFANLPDIAIVEKPDESSICKATTCPPSVVQKMTNLSSIVTWTNHLITDYDKLIERIADEDEKKILISQKNYIDQLKKKYVAIQEHENHLVNVVNGLNIGIAKYSEDFKQMLDSSETSYKAYQTAVETLSADIPVLIKLKKNIKPFSFEGIKPLPIVYNEIPYGEVKFCSRFEKQISSIDKEYVKTLIRSIFKDDKKDIEPSAVTETELNNAIKDVSDENGKSGVDLVKAKIEKQIDSDFKNIKMLIKNGEDCTTEYSAGFNSSMYFNFVSNDLNRRQILIADQPEDDISQSNISDETVPDFKRLSGRRQVILVTHNPQFVVNLDADNVIYLKKTKDGISFQNGALEYKDNVFDVLSLVEKSLDGGEESIKKRWRRYDKNN